MAGTEIQSQVGRSLRGDLTRLREVLDGATAAAFPPSPPAVRLTATLDHMPDRFVGRGPLAIPGRVDLGANMALDLTGNRFGFEEACFRHAWRLAVAQGWSQGYFLDAYVRFLVTENLHDTGSAICAVRGFVAAMDADCSAYWRFLPVGSGFLPTRLPPAFAAAWAGTLAADPRALDDPPSLDENPPTFAEERLVDVWIERIDNARRRSEEQGRGGLLTEVRRCISDAHRRELQAVRSGTRPWDAARSADLFLQWRLVVPECCRDSSRRKP